MRALLAELRRDWITSTILVAMSVALTVGVVLK